MSNRDIFDLVSRASPWHVTMKSKSENLVENLRGRNISLDSAMSLFPNWALPISSFFGPIFVADNKRCSMLVPFVSDDLFVVEVYIFLAVFLPNGVVNYGIDIFLKVSVEIRVESSMIPWTFLLFPRNFFDVIDCAWFNFIDRFLFNCVARVWFNWFARNCTLICLVFIERNMAIFLKIFFSPVFSSLGLYYHYQQ